MAKPKILLVDADVKSRQMLEISLKKAGFIVTSVEEGEKALQLLDTYLPDMIISDIDLAGAMDGFLFAQVLKDKERGPERHIPFVFLTKRKEVEDKIRGLELGVDDYLTKPIYLKEVIARVRLILDKRRQEHMEQTGPEPLFQGDLTQMSIVDLLQTMEIGGKTGILHLKRGEHDAKLYVSAGRVVHAVCDNLVGERAVYRTLLWSDGSFRIEFKKSLQTQETIHVSTQGLIMEGMRRIDELERIKEQLPPFETYLAIDAQTILEEHPDRFPAKIENILAEFNGEATLQEVVEALPYDDLESLEIISKLYFQGFLMEVDGPAAVGSTAPGTRDEATATKLPPAASTLDTQMLRLEEASRSIEQIKAKARLSTAAKAEQQASSVPPPPPANSEEVGEDTVFELAPPEEAELLASAAKHAAAKVEEVEVGETLPTVEEIVAAADLLEPPREAQTPPPPAPDVVKPKPRAVPAKPASPVAPPSDPDDERRAAALFADDTPRIPPPAAQPPAPRPVAKVTPMPAKSRAEGGVVERSGAVRVPESVPNPPAAVATANTAVPAVPAPADKRRWPWLAAAAVLLLAAIGAAFWLGRLGGGGGGGGGEDAYVLADRAQAMVARGEFASGRRLAEQAIALDPGVAAAHVAYARAERELGRSDSAIAAFARALEINPALHQARFEQIELRLARGDDTRTLRRELEALLLDLDPERDQDLMGDTAVLIARLDVEAKAWDEARASLDRAAKVVPDDPRLVVLRAKLPPTATPAAAPPPPSAQPGASAAKPKPAPAAKSAAKPAAPVEAPTIGPDGPTAAERAAELHEKGTVFYRKGYLRDARRTLEEATRIDPDNDEIWVDLGRVLVELGEDRAAMTAFQTAGRLNPRNPRVWSNLGSVYLYQGDTARARTAFETFLELVPPDSREAGEIRKVLENL